MTATVTTDPIVLSGARWFWWIAGLSVVNSALFHSGADMNFVVGLGLTMITDVILAKNLAAAVVVAALPIGFYFFMGLFAQRERLWAFIFGGIVYALDALFFLAFQDWMPLAFHALALFFIIKGLLRVRELRRNPPVVEPTEPPEPAV